MPISFDRVLQVGRLSQLVLDLCRPLVRSLRCNPRGSGIGLLCAVAITSIFVPKIMTFSFVEVVSNSFTQVMGNLGNKESNTIRDLQKKVQDLRRQLDTRQRTINRLQNDVHQHKRSLDNQRKSLDKQDLEFEKALTALREAKSAELVADERFRQQTELLSKCRDELDAANQENSALTININNLQHRPGRLSDEEVKNTMGALYHRLDIWVQHYCLRPLVKDKPSSHAKNFDIICQTQSGISGGILHEFLSRHMVADIQNQFQSTDQEVEKRFPSHILNDWRAATSTALFTLNATLLDTLLDNFTDRVVADIESQSGQTSSNSTTQRTQELKELIWDFIVFKQGLECLPERYQFLWASAKMEFHSEWMASFAGCHDSDATVDYTMFPGLFRSSTPTGATLIERAIVRILPRPKDPPNRPPEQLSQCSSLNAVVEIPDGPSRERESEAIPSNCTMPGSLPNTTT